MKRSGMKLSSVVREFVDRHLPQDDGGTPKVLFLSLSVFAMRNVGGKERLKKFIGFTFSRSGFMLTALFAEKNEYFEFVETNEWELVSKGSPHRCFAEVEKKVEEVMTRLICSLRKDGDHAENFHTEVNLSKAFHFPLFSAKSVRVSGKNPKKWEIDR